MRKLFFLFYVTVQLHPDTSAQKFTPELSSISDYEFNLKECSFDKTANAVKLMDYEEMDVSGDQIFSKTKIFRKVRIKILNELGKDAANIIIPYYGRYTMTDIKATIYNKDADGNIITTVMPKAELYNDVANKYVKSLRFTFPEVRAGSIIEYSYVKIIKNTLAIEPWFFQDKLPTLYSTCRISSPQNIPIESKIVKADSVERYVFDEVHGLSLNTRITFQRFTLRDIPAFEPEPLMSSITDNLERVDYTIAPRSSVYGIVIPPDRYWQLFNYVFNESPVWGGQIKKTIKGTEPIIAEAKKMESPVQKINFICNSIRERIGWDQNEIFYPGDLQLSWNERSGTNTEINLLLLNLLRKCGFECFPIAVSTRDNGIPQENFYAVGQFNGIIVLVKAGEQYYYYDLTQKHHIPTKPPMSVYDRDVLILDSAEASWAHFYEERPMFKTIYHVNARMDADGTMNGKAEISYYDYSKTLKLDFDEKKKKTEIEERLFHQSVLSLTTDSLKSENKNNDSTPLAESFHFKTEFSRSGNYIEFNPFVATDFPENIFQAAQRNTAIDFIGNHFYELNFDVDLPKNLKVESQLKDTVIKSVDNTLTFRRQFHLSGNQLSISMQFEILQPYFVRDVYKNVKQFFDTYSKLTKEEIILVNSQ